MASKAYIEKRKLEAQKEIADKDRAQADKDSKRRLVGDIFKGTTGVFGSILKGPGSHAFKQAGSLAGKVWRQEPSWYKKWIDEKLLPYFTNLPQYDNIQIRSLNKGRSRCDWTLNQSDPTMGVDTSGPIVMALEYLPRLGCIDLSSATSVTDNNFPINEACEALLSQIGKVNSRTVASDPDVLGMYVTLCRELCSDISEFRTNLSLANVFSAEKTQLRDALAAARGINLSAYLANRAQLREVYFNVIKRFNHELALPKELSIVSRAMWVAGCIIKDMNTYSPQYYTFKRFRDLHPVLDPDGEGIDYAGDSSIVNGVVQNIITYFNNKFTAIVEDPDFQTLIANIRAAIPAENLLTLDDILPDDIIVTEGDDHAMEQIHNIKTVPIYPEWNVLSAAQWIAFQKISTTGYGLVQNTIVPAYQHTSNTWSPDMLSDLCHYAVVSMEKDGDTLDFFKDAATHDDILEAIRLHPSFKVYSYSTRTVSGTNYITKIQYAIQQEGTELIMLAKMYCVNMTMGFIETSAVMSTEGTLLYDKDTNSVRSNALGLSFAEQFNWLFPIRVCKATHDTTDVNVEFYPAYNRGHTFVVQPVELGAINNVANKSLYFVAPSSFKSI